MIGSLVLYFTTFSLSIMFAHLYDKVKFNIFQLQKYLIFLLILSPTLLIGGTRVGIGVDYYRYVDNYIRFSNIENFEYRTSFYTEYLFKLFSYIIYHMFNGSLTAFFTMTSFVTGWIILIAADYFKKEISLSWVLFIYYCFYYIESYNAIKQFLALSIVFYSFRYLHERNTIKYIICIMIATLVHSSAFVSIVFYFVPFKAKKTQFRELMWIGLILFLPFFFQYILLITSKVPFLSSYLVRFKFSLNAPFSLNRIVLETITYFLPSLLFYFTVKRNNKDIFYLVNLGLLTLMVRYLGVWIEYAWRLNYYFMVGQMLFVPMLLNTLRKNKYINIIKLFFIVMYLLFFVYYYIYAGMGPGIPYKGSIFDFSY